MRAMCPALSEKHHAHFIAARLNDLFADWNVPLFMAISLSSDAKGVGRLPLATKSQWTSSASTTTPWRRQISPILVRSLRDQQLPVGFCGLQRRNVFVSGPMRRSKSSKSIE